MVGRKSGLSVRLRLTLSYAGFLMLAGLMLLLVVWVFLLRYVPEKIYIQPIQTEQEFSGPGATFPRAPRSLFVPNRSDLERAFVPKAAIVLVFLLMFGLVGGWLLAGRMLAPLVRITDATRRAATGSLSHRIKLEGPGDEFHELADAFDGMLERLERHIKEQQRFAANASHELRTPLAITQTLLEVARKDPDQDPAHLIERLHAVNNRAIQLTQALLLLSQTEQRSFVHEEVDLSLVAEEATETLLPLAEKHGVTIEASGALSPISGSPALLLQLVTNLIQNAILHNLPEQGTVWVSTRVHLGKVLLTVENTGEKLSPELVSTLAEPFRRGTERIHTDQAGAGLGLAIVVSITRAHNGTLMLTSRQDGGLCVTVHLPALPMQKS